MRTPSPAVFSALVVLLLPVAGVSQPCPEGTVGCSRAALMFAHREGLPGEFDVDTGWVPDGAPVQVRFHTAFVGHTALTMRGELQGSWPEPMQLEAVGTPGGGTLETDYGVELSARIRLRLDTGAQEFNWEGAIPYVPQVNFRASAREVFDPWGFSTVRSHATTPRQRIADVRLTDAIVRIPGIAGGLSFDAQAELDSEFTASSITFGLDADPITATHRRTLGIFRGGPWVEFQPVLEGALAYTVGLRVFPSLYVTLLGRRWMLTLADIPINFGPFGHTIRTAPSVARLDLPDLGAETDTLNFGDVPIGQSSERTLYVTNTGPLEGRVLSGEDSAPFGVEVRPQVVSTRTRIGVPVSFRPVTRGPIERTVVVITNDPDAPRLRVRVLGNGVGLVVLADASVTDAFVADARVDDASETDGGVATAVTDGGCGCRTQRQGRGDLARVYATALLGLALSARRRERTAG